ncbi:Aminopeptidase N, partial [Trichostrongylus colubriformis]
MTSQHSICNVDLWHLQWFGNLVTLKWWNDLWLNEGFATYMQYVAIEAITNGVMNLKDYFLVVALERALWADSVATSHPLSFKIDKAVEVSEAFSPISYQKGASFLTMIAALMGEENFNEGVKVGFCMFCNILIEKKKVS